MIGSGRHPQRNVVLTGFYAAGKTSVARELSRRMRRPVVDCESELRRRSRRSLCVLLPIGGPPPALEPDTAGSFLTDFTYRRDCILELDVATAEQIDYPDLLGEFSYVAFLDAPFELLLERMHADRRYAELLEQTGVDELHEQWLRLRQRFEQCDLQLGAHGIMRCSQYVLHSFFT